MKVRRFLFIFIPIAAVIFVILLVSENTLNDNERNAVEVVKKYKEYLKDPDSMVLRGDVLIMEKDDEYTFISFKASGNNSYGTPVTSTPIFRNETYIGDYEDDPDDLDTVQEKQILANGQLAVATWNFMTKASPGWSGGNDYQYAGTVSGKKIARKAGCEYKDE